MNNTREIGLVGLGKKDEPNPVTDPSIGNAASPDAVVSDTGNFHYRYWAYQNWCGRIGVPSATFTEWERINRQVAEDSFTFPPGKNRTVRGRGAPRGNEEYAAIA